MPSALSSTSVSGGPAGVHSLSNRPVGIPNGAAQLTVSLVDAHGNKLGTVAEPGNLSEPLLSADGAHLAYVNGGPPIEDGCLGQGPRPGGMADTLRVPCTEQGDLAFGPLRRLQVGGASHDDCDSGLMGMDGLEQS
jgi:hypothetical protein